MKRFLVLGSAILAAAAAVGAYFAPAVYWQPLLINVATTFFAVAVGIVVVNIYLEKQSRRGATRLILQLCNKAIATFHNTYLDLLWTKFGKQQYFDILKSYASGNGDPMVLSPDDRNAVYALAKSKATELQTLIQNLDEALSEVTSLAGWDLDVELLTDALKARNAIRQFRAITLDDSDTTKAKVTEHLIDIDLFSQDARNTLKRLSGVTEK